MDYQSNNHRKTRKMETPKPPEKKIEKVITGEVVKKQKPLGRKIKDIFFGGEFKSASRYIAADVLLPALRNLVVDASTKGIERIIYGESSVSRRRPPEYRPRVQYNSPISRGPAPRDPRDRAYLPDQPGHPYRQSRHEAEFIVLSSREEAELVLERMIDIIDNYDVASLADLYDLVGLPSSHTDNKWGWGHLNNASVRQVRDGYLLDLPQMDVI